MALESSEKETLRDLARRVAEIAQDPLQQENIQRWKSLNALKKGRPLIQCEVPLETWPELIPESEIVIGKGPVEQREERPDAVDTFKTDDPDEAFFRAIEEELRRRIYRWEHIRDDQVITADLYIPSAHRFTDWVEGRGRPYTGQADRAGKFEPCIVEVDDLKKLQFPELMIDGEPGSSKLDAAQDLLGEILNVVQEFPYQAGLYHSTLGWGTSAMDLLCEMRGLEDMLYDLALNSGFVHDAMAFLTEGIMRAFDQLEEAGLLRLNNNESVIGPCTQGYTDELPRNGAEPGHVTTRDVWGFAQTQELAGVSPEMLEEFVLPYQGKMTARFGLNYYGCCEANDTKWDVIKKHIPNLRGISVSPWADHEIAAAALRDDYVYSWKPHPAKMITVFDEEFIRSEMRRVFDMTKDCIVAVSLRDAQTVSGEPHRLTRWTAIAKEVAEECAPM